jgi:hypothetical protein
MTNKEYFQKCEDADWFYARSEDRKQYRRGADAISALGRTAAKNDIQNKIFNDFYGWANHNGPKPELKNYI